MFRFLWPFIRPHLWKMGAAFFLCVFVGVAVSYQNLVPKYLLDSVLLAEDVDRATQYRRLVWILGSYLLANIVFRSVFWNISLRLFESVQQQVVLAMRSRFFRHLNHLCLNFHNKYSSGELFSYMFGTPLSEIQGFLHQISMALPSAIFTMGVTLIWVGLWDWLLAVVLLIYFAVHFAVMRWGQVKNRALTTEFQTVEESVIARVGDILRASRAVKLYSAEPQMDAEFNLQARAISKKSYARSIKSHSIYMVFEGNTFVFFTLLAGIGALRYLDGHLLEGEYVAYLTAFLALQGPLGTLFGLSVQWGNATASVHRIESLLNIESTTPDVADPRPCPRQGDFVLDRVNFAHQDTAILKGISLTIPYGQRVALVGPSGGGKSTLTQLILRLYDPQQGTVTLGGTPLREIRGRELRRAFGVVPQEAYIFNTTLRKNLLAVKPEASEAELIDACKRANLWNFIESLPDGLDSECGETGARLSGGQRQRLAIARALLTDPAYFVFDEATSALDTRSEQLIQEAIERAMSGKTAILIAHRLSTVLNCDRILVMEAGRIVQDGSYEKLSREEGLFKELLTRQGMQ